MIDEIDKLRKLPLHHEFRPLINTSCRIFRVPGGWVYEFEYADYGEPSKYNHLFIPEPKITWLEKIKKVLHSARLDWNAQRKKFSKHT